MRFGKVRTGVVAILVLGLVAVLGYGGLAMAAGSGDPGSSSDPLVTKSYVEEFVGKKLAEVLGDSKSSGGMEWEIKTVETGGQFVGNDGTEFIIRGGKAVVMDPSRSGVADLTAGVNVAAGQAAAPNHLFLIPREGRGITAQTTVTIMFRGGGSVQ